MGLFDKLKFWGKKDELDIDDLAGQETLDDAPPLDELGLDQKTADLDEKPMFPEEQTELPTGIETAKSVPPPPAGGRDRDLELIGSKLDTIKALLTSLDQRVANIERSSGTVEKKGKLW